MKQILNIVLSILFFACIITGCRSPEEKVEKAKENLNKPAIDSSNIIVDSIKEYQYFKSDCENQIAKNDKEIEKLNKVNIEKNTSVDNQPVTVDKDYKFKIAKLQQQNDLLRLKINNWKYNCSYSKWNEFKEGFNHELKNLNSDITNLKNKIAKNQD